MSQDFYELLRISPNASREDIQNAYRLRIGQLVRRLRNAQERGADTSILSQEERRLTEAKEVLLDPKRRRNYDLFRKCSDRGIPSDIQQLWELARPTMLDPKLSAALGVLKQFTQLPIDQLPIVQQPAPPKTAEATTAPKIRRTTPKKKSATNLRKKPARAQVKTKPISSSISRGPLTSTQLDDLATKIGYNGKFIRAVRENRGLKLEDLAKATRISINYLRAIENNAFEQLPSTTFVKGYITNIAKTLGIDDRPIVTEYMSLFSSNR